MSIKLTATGDSCGKNTGFSPNGTYFAFGCWWHPHGSAVSGGIIGLSDSAGTDYAYLSQAATTLIIDHSGGTTAVLTHTTNTWYWIYLRNDGTNLVAGAATLTGAYSTAAVGASAPVTSPVTAGFGSYLAGDTTYGKDWCVQNGLCWSGASAVGIPTVAELQAQRTRLRPLPMVGGGSTLLLPYAWWPTLGVADLGDRSGGGQTLVGSGLELGDSPPVSWGAPQPWMNAAIAAATPAYSPLGSFDPTLVPSAWYDETIPA